MQSHQQLVDALNIAGVLNRKKERSTLDIPWSAQSLRPVRKDVLEQISIDAEPDDEVTSLFEGVAAQEVTGGLPRFGQALQRENVRVDEVAHVGWLQRAVSQAQKAVGRLFRSKN